MILTKNENSWIPAENISAKNDKKKAATFISENGFREEKSWEKLNQNTNKLVQFLKNKKIRQKDRIAAYMPNTIETVEAFISTSATKIGLQTSIPQLLEHPLPSFTTTSIIG